MPKATKVLRSNCLKVSFKIAALVPASEQQNMEAFSTSKTGPFIPKKIGHILGVFFKSRKNFITKYSNSLNMSLRKYNQTVHSNLTSLTF